MNTPNETHYHHTDSSGNETTFRVEFTYTPGSPGNISGPPEACYPAESAEIEITGVYLHSTSTKKSRGRPRFGGRFHSATPASILNKALRQIPSYDTQSKYPPNFGKRCLTFLNSGGFIGPEQFHPPTEISELLSEETIEKMEAACWEEVEKQTQDFDPIEDESLYYDDGPDSTYWENCK